MGLFTDPTPVRVLFSQHEMEYPGQTADYLCYGCVRDDSKTYELYQGVCSLYASQSEAL